MLCNYVQTLYPSCSPLHKRGLKGGAENFGKMRKMVPLKKITQITPYEYLSYPNMSYIMECQTCKDPTNLLKLKGEHEADKQFYNDSQ